MRRYPINDNSMAARYARAIATYRHADLRAALAQIDAALRAQTGVETVRLISHGEPGAITLAGQRITAETLLGRSAEVGSWGASLAPGADWLLYGCSVAANAPGRNLADTLARLITRRTEPHVKLH